MKKRISVVLVFILMLSLLQGINMMADAAAASTHIKMTITPSKSTLPSTGGTVSLSFKLDKDSGITPTNVKIYRADKASAPYFTDIDFSGSNTKTLTLASYTVPVDELDSKISFMVAWQENGTDYNNSYTLVIEKFNPNFDLTRDYSNVLFSNSSKNYIVAKKGSTITIKYTIKNTGNVDLSFPKIYDFDSSNLILQESSNVPIASGETKSFTYEKAIDAVTSSAPKVTCKYSDLSSGDTKTLEKSFEAKAIQLPIIKTTRELVANPATINFGESSDLKCTITNNGNIPLTNISVFYDVTGSSTGQSIATLDVGQSAVRTLKVTPAKTTEYKFLLKYADPSESTLINSEFTSTATVTVRGSSSMTLTLKATAEPETLDVPGEVKFKVKVTNNNTFTVSGIEIKDSSLGLTKRIESLAPSGEELVEFTATVNSSANILFTATVPNSEADDSKFYSNTLAITVTNPSAAITTPVPTDNSTVTPPPSPKGPDWLKILLYTLGGILLLIVLATAALITINIYQKKQAAKDIVVKRKMRN